MDVKGLPPKSAKKEPAAAAAGGAAATATAATATPKAPAAGGRAKTPNRNKPAAGAGAAAAAAPAPVVAAPPPRSKIGSPMSWNYNPAADERQSGGLICGDCGALNTLRPKDAIRCKDCGYRIMLKKRTRRCMVFLAR